MLNASTEVLPFLITQVADDLQERPLVSRWAEADILFGQAGEQLVEDPSVPGQLIDAIGAVHDGEVEHGGAYAQR